MRLSIKFNVYYAAAINGNLGKIDTDKITIDKLITEMT